jgi:hypothetical protein
VRRSFIRNGMAGVSAGRYRTTAISRFLHLAAAPVFGVMAFLNAGDRSTMTICASDGGSMLSGMVPMYVLMAIAHLVPWVHLIGGPANRDS